MIILEISKPFKHLKTALFVVFAALFAIAGLTVLESFAEGMLPWVTIGCPGCDLENPNYNMDQMRWFGAVHGALVGILFSGSLIAMLWKPWGKPLLLQFYILGHLIFLGAYYLIGKSNPDAAPFIELIFLFPLVLLALTFPGRGLFHNMFKQADYHRPLLLLSLAAFAIMAPGIWQQLDSQLNSDSVFSQYNRWAESVQFCLVISVAGLLAATRKPGWKQLSILIGIAYVFLGVAALSVPNQESSWGIFGGIVSILGGIGYIGIAANQFASRILLPAKKIVGGGTTADHE